MKSLAISFFRACSRPWDSVHWRYFGGYSSGECHSGWGGRSHRYHGTHLSLCLSHLPHQSHQGKEKDKLVVISIFSNFFNLIAFLYAFWWAVFYVSYFVCYSQQLNVVGSSNMSQLNWCSQRVFFSVLLPWLKSQQEAQSHCDIFHQRDSEMV